MTWKVSLKDRIPVLQWVPQYTVKRFIVHDIFAGLTLAAFAVPQAFVFSVLANLPVESGLYTTLIPPLIYFFFGTSRFMAVGPSTLIAHIIGSTVGSMADWFSTNPAFPDTLKVGPDNSRSFKTYREIGPSIAVIVSFVSALFLFVIYITRIRKFIRIILPPCLVSGFTSASAIMIISSQLQFFFGLSLPSVSSKPFVVIDRYVGLIKGIRNINVPVFVVGLSSLTIIGMVMVLDNFLTKRKHAKLDNVESTPRASHSRLKSSFFKVSAFPIALLVLIVFSLFSFFLNFEKRNIETVGPVPSGLPTFTVPWRILFDIPRSMMALFVGTILWKGLTIALVIHASTLAIIHTFSSSSPVGVTLQDRALYELFVVDEDRQNQEDQELLALSICGIIGPFFSCFAPAGSLTKAGMLSTQTKVQSPFANLIAIIAILPVLFFATDFLSYIPLATLAAIHSLSLVPMVLLIRDSAEYFKMACLYDETRANHITASSEDDQVPGLEMTYRGRSPLPVIVINSPRGGRNCASPSPHQHGSNRSSRGDPEHNIWQPTTCISSIRLFLLRLFRLCHIWKHFVIWLVTFILVLLLDTATGVCGGIIVTVLFNFTSLVYRRIQ